MAVKKSLNSTIILPKNADHHHLSAPAGDDVQLESDIRDGDDDPKVYLSCSYCCADIQLPSLLGPNNPAILGTELQDLTSLTVADFCNIKNNASDDSTPDPLLSPFICNVHVPNAKSDQEVSHPLAVAATASSDTMDVRYDKELDHDTLERIRRSTFVQQILLSTIL